MMPGFRARGAERDRTEEECESLRRSVATPITASIIMV